jgi:two-component system response regulator PilR (NtrC family)
MIHEQGPRSRAEFVPVNCGAIPYELMESEFFGHVKGSFTGAVTDRLGLFQAADGGTLFLDEIAELPQQMQVKLLRAIQEKSIRQIGSQKETHVDVRILSATHKDLSLLVADGEFRQDLYYRINVIDLKVPPLRERKSDIPLLVKHILQKSGAQLDGNKSTSVSERAMNALMEYTFPGNIRELENILHRAVALHEGQEIDIDDLQLPEPEQQNILKSDNDEALDSYLANQEKEIILETLEKTRWNKTSAAKLLGISLRALRYRLEKLGID